MNTNLLLEKYNEFKSIVGYKFEYEFEDGNIVSYKLNNKNFIHLIGLHKLEDIPLISDFNDFNKSYASAKFVISRIKKQRFLTDSIIRNSYYFPDIQERYENFNRNNLLTISYTDAIVDFNPCLIGSVLKSKYILFEQKINGYNHLGIAYDENGRTYAETFFFNKSNLYLKNQTIVKVNKARIYDIHGQVILEDNFT